MIAESAWYSELREQFRPEHIKLLLIGESASDPRASEPRFFYAPVLTRADNLFRRVVLAQYDHRSPRGSAGTSKVPWLERLKDDGVFLIDARAYSPGSSSDPLKTLAALERRGANSDRERGGVRRLGHPGGSYRRGLKGEGGPARGAVLHRNSCLLLSVAKAQGRSSAFLAERDLCSEVSASASRPLATVSWPVAETLAPRVKRERCRRTVWLGILRVAA